MIAPTKKLIQVIILGFCFALQAQIPNEEKSALLALYNATDGSNWKNTWDLSSPETTWYGISIQDNHVQKIELNGNNLKGKLPLELANLQKLEVFNVAFNGLEGSFPMALTQLSEIKQIVLEMNNLKGELPNDFSKCAKLEILSLFNNSFSGALPDGLGVITNLKELNFSGNYFEGQIPRSYESLNNLEILGLFGNKLGGDIAINFEKLPKLTELSLAHNNFIGAVPYGIEQLQELKYLQLQGNGFNSYENIKNINTSGMLTFNVDEILFDKIKIGTNANGTRMADTKLEDAKGN